MEVVLNSIVLVVGLLLGFVPAIAWLDRRMQATEPPERPNPETDAESSLVERLLQDADAALRALGRSGQAPTSSRWLHGAAPRIAALIPLTAFAWIPIAGVPGIGGVRGAAAESEVGALFVAALLALACLTPALAAVAGREEAEMRSGLAEAGVAVGLQLPLLVSVVALGMVFGSLSLPELATAQDRTLPLGRIFEAGFGPTRAGIPAWGLFFQPLGFVVFFACAVLACPPTRITGPLADEEQRQPGGYRLATCVHVALIAAFTATLYFGGFAIPGLASSSLVAALASVLGDPVAIGVCAVLQALVFGMKLLFVAWLVLAARTLLPRESPQRGMRRCWFGWLPLSIVNLLGTAWFVAVWTAP